VHAYRLLTDPSYISEQMFDRVASEKFINNSDDLAVRMQAIELVRILRASQSRDQIITDILHAAKVSGANSSERVAEIGFSMGLQFGFELAISYPPLSK
jgi:hypothetical protein